MKLDKQTAERFAGLIENMHNQAVSLAAMMEHYDGEDAAHACLMCAAGSIRRAALHLGAKDGDE